jgi:hypothetical protein
MTKKRTADTTLLPTANASKQMPDHVRRVHNALNNASLLRDPQMKAAELKLACEELDKTIAILERTK